MEQNATESEVVRAPEAEGAPTQATALRWGRVMLAPVLDLFRPRAAAACLVSASRPAFAVVLALSLLGYAAVLIGLMLWEGTLVEAIPRAYLAPGSTAPLTYPPPLELQRRSVAEVWREWHDAAFEGWLGPAEATVILVVILGLLALLFLAWLNLPLVHGVGSVWGSYKRAFRASAAIICPVAVLTIASGVPLILRLHASYDAAKTLRYAPLDEPEIVLFPCLAVSAVLLVLWLAHAITGVAPDASRPELPPRCEGCGYDLTHQPAEGRCSECGLRLDASLVADLSRPDSRWVREPTSASWAVTCLAVLFGPRAFYRTLRLRTPTTVESRFVAWNFVRIAEGAFVWALIMIILLSRREYPPTPSELAIVLLAITCVVPLGVIGCWLGHRVVQSLVASWWLVRRALPDFRWAARVAAYETSFLWVFCVFWGSLLGSMVLFDCWLSALVGGARRGPPTAEMLFAGWGTLGLVVVWLVRYAIAYRAIRWSNF